jgi:hypothetical protein
MMQRIVRTATLLLIVGLLSVAPAMVLAGPVAPGIQAAAKTAAIIGTVLQSNGALVGGADVFITAQGVMLSTKTDGTGRLTLRGCCPLRPSGFAPKWPLCVLEDGISPFGLERTVLGYSL